MAVEQEIFKIVVTGPESSGKTTLAQALASALGSPCVPEFARAYLEHLGRPYDYNDLKMIALGQKTWEDWFTRSYNLLSPPPLHSSNPPLILDTDWTVIRIWEYYKYGTTGITTPLPPLAPLYLLCSPDFDWQPDPLREHPNERTALFRLYLDLLQTSGANFQVLKGAPETRLQTALQIIPGYY
ncbi:MAG: ATP-binding protein [Saprospiraceae bacterium]